MTVHIIGKLKKRQLEKRNVLFLFVYSFVSLCLFSREYHFSGQYFVFLFVCFCCKSILLTESFFFVLTRQVASAFRDFLHREYKSSNKAKTERRKKARRQKSETKKTKQKEEEGDISRKGEEEDVRPSQQQEEEETNEEK